MGYTVGLDLGTTFTAAAVMRDGKVDVVSLGNHAVAIPSVVFLREDGELLVGEAAVRRSAREPVRAARAFKRRFGDAAPIILDRTPFSADRLSVAILTSVMAEVEKRQGASPDKVAVTHPANWGGFKTDLLRATLTQAGLGDALMVPEPVAAAVQYSSTSRVDVGDVVAVYDLGGGTFDAAVLQKTADGFDILGQPQGLERLGGIDFDDAVLAHVRSALGDALAAGDQDDPAVREGLSALRDECVAAKEALSADSDATIRVNLPHLRTEVRITRNEFEDAIRPMVRETVQALRRALDSAKVPTDQVKAVLLAGGSSRIPLAGELLAQEFGRPVVADSHPKHTVAMGAARAATQAVRPAAAGEPQQDRLGLVLDVVGGRQMGKAGGFQRIGHQRIARPPRRRLQIGFGLGAGPFERPDRQAERRGPGLHLANVVAAVGPQSVINAEHQRLRPAAAHGPPA